MLEKTGIRIRSMFAKTAWRRLVIGMAVVTALAFVVAHGPSADPRVATVDSLARAKHVAWLNNWSAAARVLERLNQTEPAELDDGARILTKAVQIRGNIESLSLPAAAKELDAMLAAPAATIDSELRVQMLAMKGDVEFQYDLAAAEGT